jgi:hypothetical protein
MELKKGQEVILRARIEEVGSGHVVVRLADQQGVHTSQDNLTVEETASNKSGKAKAK